MKNCLVKEYKASVDNTSLPYYGELVFHVHAFEGNRNNCMYIAINQGGEQPIIEGLGGTFKVDGDNTDYTSYAIPLTGTSYIAKIFAENKEFDIRVRNAQFALSSISFATESSLNPYKVAFGLDLSTISSKIAVLIMANSGTAPFLDGVLRFIDPASARQFSLYYADNCGFDLNSLEGSTQITTFNLVGTKSVGNINKVARNKNCSSFNFRGSSLLEGSIDSFAAAQYNSGNGKISGSTTVYTKFTNITCSITDTYNSGAFRIDYTSSGYTITNIQ